MDAMKEYYRLTPDQRERLIRGAIKSELSPRAHPVSVWFAVTMIAVATFVLGWIFGAAV